MENEFKKSKVSPIFGLVKDEQKKVRIVIGKYVASEKSFDTYKQAEQYLGTKPYELLANMMCISYLTMRENEKTKTNLEGGEKIHTTDKEKSQKND